MSVSYTHLDVYKRQVMNLSPYAIHADYYTGIYAGMYTDAMTGVACELRGHVEEDMAPWSYRILTR